MGINKNVSNQSSFTSLYLITKNEQDILLDIDNIVGMVTNELPTECMQTMNNKINRMLVNDKEGDNISECPPSAAWEYFVWSMSEWWVLYVFVLLIGAIIGCLTI